MILTSGEPRGLQKKILNQRDNSFQLLRFLYTHLCFKYPSTRFFHATSTLLCSLALTAPPGCPAQASLSSADHSDSSTLLTLSFVLQLDSKKSPAGFMAIRPDPRLQAGTQHDCKQHMHCWWQAGSHSELTLAARREFGKRSPRAVLCPGPRHCLLPAGTLHGRGCAILPQWGIRGRPVGLYTVFFPWKGVVENATGKASQPLEHCSDVSSLLPTDVKGAFCGRITHYLRFPPAGNLDTRDEQASVAI